MAKVKKKKTAKKPANKDITVKLPMAIEFDEVMTRIVRVKPPKKQGKGAK